jgi:outer membrane lipoprotein-sorting protein
MRKIFLILGCMALGWIGGPTTGSLAQGKSLSVQEIVDRSNLAAYYEGKDGRSRVNMTITDSQGRTRERRFIILRRDDKDGGDQKFYVHFSRPSDVRNMVFMVWKHIGQNDDRWLYLPALDLVKRIAASDKRTSFVGSHFFYEDVSGRNPADDTHELTETTGQYYVLKNTPKNLEEVEFAYYMLWVDKTHFLPIKAEYYDKNKKKYRLVESLKVKTIQGRPTVTEAKVSDLKSGGHTVSVFSKIQYDLGIKDSIFTERYLRRAPRRWLK